MSDEPRLDSLTGLRAAAAGVVLLSHVRWLIPDDPLFHLAGRPINARIVLQQGDVGVSLFFLLSGFVLLWSHRPDDAVTRFWGRRFGRIYPSHVVVWAVWVALAAATVLPATSLGPALADLLLVQSWVPDPRYYLGVNPPTWSLSCEVLFYALFPAIALVLLRLRDRAVGAVAVGAGALALAIPVACTVLDGRIDGYYFSYVFPPSRVPEFVLGAALALLVRRGHLRRVPLGWAMAAAAVAYLIAGRTPRILSNVAVTLVPFVLLLVAAAGADLAGRPSLWRHRVLRHLGEISLAVYLVQYGVIEVLRPTRGPEGAATFAGGLALSALAIALTLVLAEVLHHVVERPAERWFRRRCSRPDGAPLATLAAGAPAGSTDAA
jgi:peptidoglycan/LPS O-acetylase OafA/YrhL